VSARRKQSLKRRWEGISSVPGLKKDIAALAVLVLAAIVATIGTGSFIGGTNPFADRFILKAEFEQVPGLNPNATPHVPTIAGVRVGDVTGYEPTDHGTAIVTMSLDPKVTTIYDNATALLRPKNPLNDMQITINPGNPPGKPLASGGLIPVGQTKRPIQINEALGHLDERAQAAINDLMVSSDIALVNAPRDFPAGIAATDQTLQNLRPVMTALQVRKDNIAKLVTALSQIATALGGDKERAVKLADATQQTLRVIAANDKDLVATFDQFPGLSNQLRSALSATQDLTKELNPTLDNLSKASKDLPDALKDFKKTAHELGETADEAKDFVKEAKPVVADLKPFVSDLSNSVDDLQHITKNLDRDTDVLKTYLTVLHVFFVNTKSVFGTGDANGTQIRGHASAALPDATQFLPGGEPGYAPGPEGGVVPGKPNAFTPIPAYVPGESSDHKAQNTGGR
jgi:phospholipid/cholesterol/gamma-HCH transport system substrate-binding protein